MFKTIETTLPDGKLIKFSGNVVKLDDDTTGFSIFNECGDHWEWGLLRTNEFEHYMPDALAVGLTFNKSSAKTMAATLRHIAEILDKE
jgi:hypothetical protein